MIRLATLARASSRLLARLARDTQGNTLMIIAAALLPLLAMVGSGIDMGRAYLVQARLQQGCDAGVLAARKRLGSSSVVTGQIPDDTIEIGERFFNVNFRTGSYGSTSRAFEMILEEDFSITGAASSRMPTVLMGIFGFDHIDVATTCSAQINSTNSDIMMVLDTTGSMATINPGDTEPRINVLKNVIRNFHAQLSASALSGTRIRYGFVPYSTNVNVGHLLRDEWMVDLWGYQSRRLETKLQVVNQTSQTPAVYVSGAAQDSVASTYPATSTRAGYSCPTVPVSNTVSNAVLKSEASEQVLGPPPGTRTTKRFERTRNGDTYRVTLDGQTCSVLKTAYAAYVEIYDEVTQPAFATDRKWLYDRLLYDVSDWRNTSNGCIEERQTYQITDYDNVDFSRALDLNLDLIPTDDPVGEGISILETLVFGAGSKGGDEDEEDEGGSPVRLPEGSATRWRPMFPAYIYGREMEYNGKGSFKTKAKETDKEYISPSVAGTASCPPQASKLAAMTSSDLDSYLATLSPRGSTYHDIGMIWGGRLLSPTGLFASENANVSPSAPTNRNLIFLTDGETAPLDISYSSYGFEPLDQRRWSPSSPFTLAQTVENRFSVACREVKKRGITVWVIGFGTELGQFMQGCAGEGHYFEAADAAELNLAFATIANKVSELRIIN